MSMKVGVVGMGIMGSAIARNLVKNGFEVFGHDILAKQNQLLKKNGGTPLKNAKEVAQKSDIVLTSLPKVSSLDDVVGGKNGLLEAKKKGLIVCELSTFPIEDKVRNHDLLKKAGITMLDCPLSGTGAQAQTGDLAIYASGLKGAYNKCTDVFEGFGRVHFYVGPFGDGMKMKFVANHLVHIHNIAAGEAMVMGMKSGLDPDLMLEVIGSGAASSRMWEVRGPMMAKNKYKPAGMKVDVWHKDMSIIGDFAAKMHCPTPLFDAGRQLYHAASEQGYDMDDTAVVCRVLENMAQLKRPKKKGAVPDN